jgi:hypothetical protein
MIAPNEYAKINERLSYIDLILCDVIELLAVIVTRDRDCDRDLVYVIMSIF